jgi:hypothetical protein
MHSMIVFDDVKDKKLQRRNKALVTIFSTIMTLKTLFCNSQLSIDYSLSVFYTS